MDLRTDQELFVPWNLRAPWGGEVGAWQFSQLMEVTAVIDTRSLPQCDLYAGSCPPALLIPIPWPSPPPWHGRTPSDGGALGEPQALVASMPTPHPPAWVGGCRPWEDGGLISEPVLSTGICFEFDSHRN